MPDSSIRSPRVAAWLTRFCLHEVDADVVLGDLEETYAALHRRYGRRAARRWYWSQVLRSGPTFVHRTLYWSLVMWKNYVVASLRKFRRTKIHTLVNVIGLTSVRKVLGASVGGIVLLLSKDFTRLVGIAFVVAVPVAYFAMSRWLEDFAYRVDISWWIFLIAGLAALGIALVTVSYQSIKAALADPVDSLRYE